MKSKIFFSFIFFFSSVMLFAQENETKDSITYSNLTEFGIISLSPQCFSFETTVVQGFALNRQHHFGLGIGIGGHFRMGEMTDDPVLFSIPVFLNYRYYFKPDKTFSPHLNAVLGGMMLNRGWGLCAAIATGFRVGKFTLASGLSFLALKHQVRWYENVTYFSPSEDYYYEETIERTFSKWSFPLGITLKWGFAF
jgi:hypothetical protein